MDYNDIKAVIKARRKELNLTMQQLGDKLGTGKSKQFVYQIENADSININTIIEVCNALDLSITIQAK